MKTKEFFCDICGKTCNAALPYYEGKDIEEFRDDEFAVLEAKWGYHSRKDQSHYKCIMCEDCFDEVAFFIKHVLKGKIPHALYNMMTLESELDFIKRDEDDNDTEGFPEPERAEEET